MSSTKIQWRVQTKSRTTGKWKNRGLFETRLSARVSAMAYRICHAYENGVRLEPFGYPNTRVVRYVKGEK